MDKFPEFIIRYNLACYCCQLGKMQEAVQWIKRVIELADKKDIQQMALSDLDLKPLWDTISEI